MADRTEVSPLTEGTTLLHVGPPKTGSTTLQSAFLVGREPLAQAGIRILSEGARARAAVNDLRSGQSGWVEEVERLRASGAAAREWISNEDFASVSDDEADRLLRGLGPATTQVVYVVRPLERLLPSQWQQRVRRSLRAPAYDDWLRLVLADAGGEEHHEHFWARHRLADQVAKWARTPGRDPSQLTFVIAREGDHSHLLQVFGELMGVPDHRLEAAPSRNSSISLSVAEFLRSLDQAVSEGSVDRNRYRERLKVHIARALRDMPKDPRETPILLPAWAVDRVRQLDAERVDFLSGCGATVIGDPAWLLQVEPRVRAADPTEPERLSVDRVATLMAWALERGQGASKESRGVARRPQPSVRRQQRPTVDELSTRQLMREVGARLVRRR